MIFMLNLSMFVLLSSPSTTSCSNRRSWKPLRVGLLNKNKVNNLSRRRHEVRERYQKEKGRKEKKKKLPFLRRSGFLDGEKRESERNPSSHYSKEYATETAPRPGPLLLPSTPCPERGWSANQELEERESCLPFFTFLNISEEGK